MVCRYGKFLQSPSMACVPCPAHHLEQNGQHYTFEETKASVNAEGEAARRRTGLSASREQGTWPCPKTQQHTATTTLFQNCPPRRQARPAPLVAGPIWLMATGQVSEIREATSERTTAVTTMSAPSGTALAKGSPETGWGQHSRLSARTSNGGLVGEPLRFFAPAVFESHFVVVTGLSEQ